MPLRQIDAASQRSALSFSIILTRSASDAAWDPSHHLSALNLSFDGEPHHVALARREQLALSIAFGRRALRDRAAVPVPGRIGRVSQPRSYHSHGGKEHPGRARLKWLQSKSSGAARHMRPLREVPNVLCHDHFATPDIRRRQHVAVLRIWQFRGRDQRVIAGHKAIARLCVHKIKRSLQGRHDYDAVRYAAAPLVWRSAHGRSAFRIRRRFPTLRKGIAFSSSRGSQSRDDPTTFKRWR